MWDKLGKENKFYCQGQIQTNSLFIPIVRIGENLKNTTESARIISEIVYMVTAVK